MSPELKFQKEMIESAKQSDILAEITTHKFKKGWPDLWWKYHKYPAIHAETKYVDLNPLGKFMVPVEPTELQKLCLKNLQKFNVMAMILIKVTVDKKDPIVYLIRDINLQRFDCRNNDLPYFIPDGRNKRGLSWPVIKMTEYMVRSSTMISLAWICSTLMH